MSVPERDYRTEELEDVHQPVRHRLVKAAKEVLVGINDAELRVESGLHQGDTYEVLLIVKGVLEKRLTDEEKEEVLRLAEEEIAQRVININNFQKER